MCKVNTTQLTTIIIHIIHIIRIISNFACYTHVYTHMYRYTHINIYACYKYSVCIYCSIYNIHRLPACLSVNQIIICPVPLTDLDEPKPLHISPTWYLAIILLYSVVQCSANKVHGTIILPQYWWFIYNMNICTCLYTLCKVMSCSCI